MKKAKDSLLRFAMILRESVLQQKEAGVAFVQGGGSPAEPGNG